MSSMSLTGHKSIVLGVQAWYLHHFFIKKNLVLVMHVLLATKKAMDSGFAEKPPYCSHINYKTLKALAPNSQVLH